MIRITSIEQALALRGTISALAIIRSLQFMGDGYSPEEHGYIIVLQANEDLLEINGIGNSPDFDFEYIEAFIEDDHIVYEAVFQIDNSRTIAVIIPDEPWLGEPLRTTLKQASVSPQPLPTLDRRAL
jgi:hypothetical protein